MSPDKIYVDNAATMPMNEIAFKTMLPYFMEEFGNPSATYQYGIEAKSAVEQARKTIANAIGARNNEIFFTSGGTESDNWALLGAAKMKKNKGKHIITSAVEHSAIFKTALMLKEQDYDITFLPVDKKGAVNPKDLENSIRPDTILISIMLANNEIGTIMPIKELSHIAHTHKILFHTDAVQAVGHIPIDVEDLGIDLLSMSGHKFGGPKGVGALYAKIPILLPPFIYGGGQEKGLRSGTLNVTGIIGMAAALNENCRQLTEKCEHITAMRENLIEGILRETNGVLTGARHNRLPGMASFIFEGYTGALLVAKLNDYGICTSSGSSCSAGSGEPSRILMAAGYSKKLSTSALRLSLSERNTMEEVNRIISILPQALAVCK